MSKPIAFDILIRSPASGREPRVSNVEDFRAPEEAIERCRRWLVERGVVCRATDFGLACEADAEVFGSLFGSQLEPSPPGEIEDLVESVTIARKPDFF